VSKALRVLLVLRVSRVLQGHKVIKEPLDYPGHKDYKDQLDLLVLQDRKEPQAQ
jgi:hypothetical protein